MYHQLTMKVTWLCPTLCNPMDCSPPGFCPWNSPDKSTGLGCHFLLQGIFLIQGSNPNLLYWQTDSLQSESPEKPPVDHTLPKIKYSSSASFTKS